LLGDLASRRSSFSQITRRQLLAAAAGLPLFSADTKKAETSVFDLSLLYEPIVPNELFFVREHFRRRLFPRTNGIFQF